MNLLRSKGINDMRKIWVIIAMILAFAILSSGSVFAQTVQTSEINVSIDGTLIDFIDAKPLIIENRVWIPVRIVSESLGATVTFDPYNLNEQTIKINKEERYGLVTRI